MSVLVIGKNSKIGDSIFVYLNKNNYQAIGTTRGKNDLQHLYLDLLDINFSSLDNLKISVVLICASITNIEECERDQKASREVNVTGVIRLLNYLDEQGVFIIYLSSSAVYSGEKKLFCERDLVCPSTAYGLQKSEVEKFIQQSPRLRKNVAIVRPTKIITLRSELFTRAMMDLKNSKSIVMFNDYLLSPISMSYVQSSLLKLIKMKIPGIYHLSGEGDVSYFEIFKKIASALGMSSELVLPSSKLTLSRTLFDQKNPSLSMDSTSINLGLFPQKLDCVIKDLLNE